MNKEQLIIKTAQKRKTPYRDVTNCLNDMIEVITEELKKGNDVAIAGLGIFRAKKRAQTKKILPNNGNGPGKGGKKVVFNVPEKRYVKFILSPRIKLDRAEDSVRISRPKEKKVKE